MRTQLRTRPPTATAHQNNHHKKQGPNVKKSWSDILFIASDVVLAAYLLVAFTSFSRNENPKARCSKVDISIADGATNGFLDAKTIKQNLQKAGCYPDINKRLDMVNTRHIEETLLHTPFVKTAQCYKTEGGHVYISVTQRMPVIRIKADNGDDYYVDDNDCIMPNTKYTSDLIIATGAISRSFAIRYLSPLGKVIMANDMWSNLIEQVNVLPDNSIEIIPRIGDHIVCLGQLPEAKKGKNNEKDILDFMTKKMTRLVKFYKYGLNTVGWNKYSYINIEFDNQIICKQREGHARTIDANADGTPATINAEQHDTPSSDNAAQGNGDNTRNASAETTAKPATGTARKAEGGNKPNSTDKTTDERRTVERKASDKKAVDKKTTEKKASEKKASDKKATDKKAADKKANDKKTADSRNASKAKDKKNADKKTASTRTERKNGGRA